MLELIKDLFLDVLQVPMPVKHINNWHDHISCSWCVRAKDLLKSQQIGFHVVELDAIPNGEGFKVYQEIRAKTGQTTVPNIFIKGKQ